jgi:hypothetical protein
MSAAGTNSQRMAGGTKHDIRTLTYEALNGKFHVLCSNLIDRLKRLLFQLCQNTLLISTTQEWACRTKDMSCLAIDEDCSCGLPTIPAV